MRGRSICHVRPDRDGGDKLVAGAENQSARSLVTASRWWTSGLEMLGLGTLVAVVAEAMVLHEAPEILMDCIRSASGVHKSMCNRRSD